MDLMPWMQQQGMLPAAGETVLCAVSRGAGLRVPAALSGVAGPPPGFCRGRRPL